MIRHTVYLDAADWSALTDTGSLTRPLGDRTLELHTGRPQWPDSLTVEFSDDDLYALRKSGEVEFLTGFGAVEVLLADEAAAR